MTLFDFMDEKDRPKPKPVTVECVECGGTNIKTLGKRVIDDREMVGIKCENCKAKTVIPLRLWEKSTLNRGENKK